MAKSDAVWGIDIGNCSLKAVRLRPSESPHQVEALAFDYIEYPKILTQPGADPVELIAEALKQFQSRNSVRGDKVAISVPGQNGLARFIKLPPVETKKIPEIVRYEARQQIPFDLDDVVWDYQAIGGGEEIEGFALETEVGLFAMKRDQVYRALEPFRSAGIEVEFVQLTPLALYNFICFDRFTDVASEEYDPEEPPESTVVLSMGTDATDLVITNGHRVWQRSIPLGGNHFTKALTKELKLTFAKAEHLKRNAATAEDPKAVFQAMRPVFNDLVTEIQRSVSYFTNINRSAKIGGMVALGNAAKLPGLRRFLSQSMGFEVTLIETFRGLVGAEVINAPAFKENIYCFGPSVGLAVQGLQQAALQTNLLPAEILKERMIRWKKPWAVAAAAVVLLGCTLSFVSYSRALGTVDNQQWSQAETEADRVDKKASEFESEVSAAATEFNDIDGIGANLTGNVEGRLVWNELMKAIHSCLPYDPPDARPEDISQRNELHVTSFDCQRIDDPASWVEKMKQQEWYEPPPSGDEETPAAATVASADQSDTAADADESDSEDDTAVEAGSKNPVWVIQLTGYHYHNFEVAGPNQGAQYVRNTLIKNLHNGKVILPKYKPVGVDEIIPEGFEIGDEPFEEVTMKQLGIGFPVLINPGRVRTVRIANPDAEPVAVTAQGGAYSGLEGYAGGMQGYGEAPPAAPSPTTSEKTAEGDEDEEQEPPYFEERQFDFVVQFIWKVTPPYQRLLNKAEAAKAAAAAQAEAEEETTDAGGQPEPGSGSATPPATEAAAGSPPQPAAAPPNTTGNPN